MTINLPLTEDILRAARRWRWTRLLPPHAAFRFNLWRLRRYSRKVGRS